MGRLGLGVPEDVLAGARKTALLRPPPSADKVTGTAREKPLDESVPSGLPSGEPARISMGIPRSVMEKAWLGLPAGESSLELELELGL